jgi:hypothetical protein
MTAGRNSSESLSHHWCTPPKYVEAIHAFFNGVPDLDPCSNLHSIVKAKTEYILPEHNGLNEIWDYPKIFVNPPYGSDRQRGTTIKDWLRKCSESNKRFKSEVLALVPVATNTKHWKQYVFGAATSVSFLYDTRLKFLVNGVDGGKGAPMSCSMIYWGSNYEEFQDIFILYGAVVDLRHLHSKPVGLGNHPTLFDLTKLRPAV